MEPEQSRKLQPRFKTNLQTNTFTDSLLSLYIENKSEILDITAQF